MIKEEYVLTRADGVEIYKHYSDEEKYIIQVETGIKYEIAEDPHPCKYTYIESDEYLPNYIERLNAEVDEKYTDEVIEQAVLNTNVTKPYTVINNDLELDSNEVN